MKKNIIIIMMAFAALFMTQCKKQSEPQTNEPVGAKMEVKVRVENASAKTEITPNGIVTWKRGDMLLVVGSEDGPLGVVFATSEGSTTADFEGAIEPFTTDQVLRFYYISPDNFYLESESEMEFYISEQDGTLDGIASLNQLMFGKTSTPVAVGTANFGTISMTSMIAIAHMNISCNDSPVSLVTVDALSSLTFNPMTYNGEALTGTPGTITVSFTEPATSTDCYIALLPGTQTLHFSGNGAEATLGEKNVESNSFYSNNGDPVHVEMESTPEYVDLGLPSGLLWATRNVGAEIPGDYGDYFAWGATAPFYQEGYAHEYPQEHWLPQYPGGYSWQHCPFTNGTYSDGNTKVFTKYIPEDYALSLGYNDYFDNKDKLDLEDDVAHVICGNDWRMPTINEFRELMENTTYIWKDANETITLGGKTISMPNGGAYFVSKADGFTDKYVFLPASGNMFSSYGISNLGTSALYWSSSLYTVDAIESQYIVFNNMTVDAAVAYYGRYCGMPVRPVYDPQN